MLKNVSLCIKREKKRGFASEKMQNANPIGRANVFSQGDAAK